MATGLSENTIRQIVQIAAESLGEQATVENVRAAVSATLERLKTEGDLGIAPKDTAPRQKFYTELLGDWLRAVENSAPHPLSTGRVQETREPQAPNFIITVLGRDRAGVVAEIARVLGDHNCSIQDMSQQILNGFFTMIMVVTLEGCTVEFAVLRDRLQETGTRLGVKVLVQHRDVFEYMHRV